MELKDQLEIIVIPITLALIAILWPVIQNQQRRYIFHRLILRELEEISPYPEHASFDGWWEHCQKRFIHPAIFEDIKENRDFILSLEPDLTYWVSQLWHSLDTHNWEQWIHYLHELSSKYDETCNGKISKSLHKWELLHDEYEKKV